MTYYHLFEYLKKNINCETEHIDLNSVELFNCKFESQNAGILPGAENHYCKQHNLHFRVADQYLENVGIDDVSLHIPDSVVESNKKFIYHIFKSKTGKKSNGAILLLHGFNEKYWDKYYPWAYTLAEATGKSVILFPIAFHMNRAPGDWTEKKNMFKLSEERKEHYPNVVGSSLSNVAISVRLHSMPQRFIWSGLQSYYDIIQLITEIKEGKNRVIDKDASIDFFCYSIGALLAEVILLSNYNGYFDNSKLCIFCGGAVFNRLSPVSKFILDSEANVALYSYLVEHIEMHKKNYERLNHYLHQDHPEGFNLYCMLDYKNLRDYREEKFSQLDKQILAIALKQDKVVPAYEIINTLQGAAREIDITVEIYDFDYPYSHENPFPPNPKIADAINKGYEKVFTRAVSFLE